MPVSHDATATAMGEPQRGPDNDSKGGPGVGLKPDQSAAPAFATRDPSQADFWTERFDRRFTPWERHGVPQRLREFVLAAPVPLSTFIPGCGSGHDVGFLADAGWEVCAIDFSAAAVATAHAQLGSHAARVRQADFFAYDPPQPLDLIYERAFVCALPRALWPRIIERYAAHLPSGALLAGFFFFDTAPKGPPFGASAGVLEALLMPAFERIDDQPVPDSIAAFAGRERWQVWRRR